MTPSEGPARATKVSPYVDNLRHMYESNPDVTIESIALYENVHPSTVWYWLKIAGTKMRPPGYARGSRGT